MTAVALAALVLAAGLLLALRRHRALVADAAHELRSPLTAITLGLEALAREPSVRRRAETLLAELGRLHVAADDLVAAARGRRATGAPRAISLGELVELSAAAWRPLAHGGGGRVLIDWDAGEAMVRGDPRRLSQALGNVLSNAVEHGGGEITVSGRRTPVGVRVVVADRGRASSGPERAPDDLQGRGLAIARRAVRTAGGRLSLEEGPGRGRRAVIDLPLERAR